MFLLALPVFAAANSPAIQSVVAPVYELLTASQIPLSTQVGITPLADDESMVGRFSAGGNHSLAIKADGTLWSWGDNTRGATGLETMTGNQLTPAQVGTATNWTQVSAGSNHSLAIKADGTLWSWGDNWSGTTGLGTTTGNQTTPAQVGTATNWTQVSAGSIHSLALQSDGTLWAWGDNLRAPTGLGTTTGTQNTPAQVGTATNWTQVSAGVQHSLGIRADGTLWAWGSNTLGRTGLGVTAGTQTTPIQVGTATNWAAVSAGPEHSHAVRLDGTLWAWGNNTNGRTGRGITTGIQNAPAQVGTATNWTQVSVAGIHSLALQSDGTLWSWGNNGNGRTGFGTTAGDQTTPRQVGTATDWLLASVGGTHSLGMRTDGTLWSWGSNLNAQLGKGITSASGMGVGTNNTLPWRIAASPIPQAAQNWLPAAGSAGSATTPYNGRLNVTPDSTPHIIIRFDRQMCTDPTSLGTIEINNGATVDVANGTWSSGVVNGVTIPVSVFSADLNLATSGVVHTVVASGFRDAFLGEVMYPHGTGPGGAYPSTAWTFSTGEIPIPAAVIDVEPKGHGIAVEGRNLYVVFDQLIHQSNPERQITLSWTEADALQTLVLDLSDTQWCPDDSILTVALPTLKHATAYTITIDGFMSLSNAFMEEPFIQRFVTEPADLDIAITKNLLMPEGTVTPETNFEFNIVPYSLNGETSTAELAFMPDLSVPALAFRNTDAGTVDGDVVTVTHITDFLLGYVLPFDFASIYVYRISEKNDTFTNTDTETMVFDDTVYQLTFVVENLPEPAPPNIRFVRAIFLQLVVDGVAGPKIDITDNLTDALVFNNIFIQNHDNDDPLDPAVAGGLRISKTVEGALANQTRFFDFDLSIWVPSLLTTPTAYRAYVLENIAGVPTIVTAASNGTVFGTSDNGDYLLFSHAATQTISLRHGQTLVFAGTHVGTRYSVTEHAAATYTPSVAVLTNGQAVFVAPADTANTALTVPMQILGENANRAAFTNELSVPIETGLDVGKFGMFLLLAAVVALIVIVTVTRRSKHEMELQVLTH